MENKHANYHSVAEGNRFTNVHVVIYYTYTDSGYIHHIDHIYEKKRLFLPRFV